VCVEHVTAKLGVAERLACKVPGQHRSTQRKVRVVWANEPALTDAMVSLAGEYGPLRLPACHDAAAG
jgi:hypothetical protein